MVKNSFQVCNITSLDPDTKHNSAFFKQCMGKTIHNLKTDDANEIVDDPFKLYDQYTIMKSVVNHFDLL